MKTDQKRNADILLEWLHRGNLQIYVLEGDTK